MRKQIDTYYVDLARNSLNGAERDIMQTQNYYRDAGLSIDNLQKIIELIRKENDFLALVPKKTEDECESEANSTNC